MSQRNNYESMFDLHYAAIQDAIKGNKLTTQTLTSLSVKRSQQAVDAGYIQLRGTLKIGQRTLPAVWVTDKMLSVFLKVCQEDVEKKAKQTEDARVQTAQRKQTLETLLQNASQFEKSIAHAEWERNPKRLPERIVEDVRRAQRLIDAISEVQEKELHWATRVVLETPLTALKGTVVLLVECPVRFNNPVWHRYNAEKEVRLSISSDVGVKKLQMQCQELRSAHDSHVSDLAQLLQMADYWHPLISRAIWDDVVRKSAQNPQNINEMLQTVLKKIRQTPAVSTRVESLLNQIVVDIPGCGTFKMSDKKTSFIYSMMVRQVEVTHLTADQILLQVIKQPDYSVPAHEHFHAQTLLAVQSAKTQYEASFDTVSETLRKVVSPVFDNSQVMGGIARQMPSRVNATEFNLILRSAAERVREHFSSLLSVSELVNKYGDDWVVSRYAHARALKRKIVVYAGPTNSGKTYHAYESVKDAKSILYLAPLRLLAMEGYDKMLSMGLGASLITGEERLGDPESRYVASTVEMCNPNRVFDAAIVDEAQMLCDPDRGSAWTAALLGVAARSVYLTCPEESVEMLVSLFALTGESVEIVRLERKSSLQITDRPVPVNKIKKGTAFIAFSRRDLLSFKEVFESRGLKCALIYGALSPEVRRAQAQRFNSGQADVLLSTDAIAMGLNLPIQHVVIGQSKKFNGTNVVDVDPALLRQIGGRAGRYGITENGLVSGVDNEVHQSIKKAFSHITEFRLNKFHLGLDHAMIEVLSTSIGSLSLMSILAQFKKVIGASTSEFVVRCTEMQQQMFGYVDSPKLIESLGLNTRFSAACAPVNKDNYEEWTRWVQMMSGGLVINAPRLATPKEITGDSRQLKRAEEDVALLNLYRWMHYQFPGQFPELDFVSASLKEKDTFIYESLKKTLKKRCLDCGCALSMQWFHPRCDSCFGFRRTERVYAFD